MHALTFGRTGSGDLVSAVIYGGLAVVLIAGSYSIAQAILARIYGESLEDKNS